MKLHSHTFLAGLAALLLTPAAAQAQEGDPVAGKQLFNKCRACHEAEKEQNKVGPHLVGVVGRTAGSLESYKPRYSASMREAGEEGLVWNEENLTEYLRDPKAFLPNGKMIFPGLKSDEDLANVIAYLKADPKP